MSHLRRPTAIALLLVAMAACSGINVTRWRAPNYAAGSVKSIAVLPLLVAGATQQHKVTNIGFAWMSQYTWTTELSPAQYMPAATLMSERLSQALHGRSLVLPNDVDAAMHGARVANVSEAVTAVAKQLSADAVLVFEIRDFSSRPAGIEEARAWARADIVLYAPDAKPLFTISADVTRGPVGTNAAPSLQDLMEYALDQLTPEIQKQLDG